MPDSSFLNPYRGLRPYAAVDAASFYGRSRLVSHLLSQLHAPVAGSSTGPLAERNVSGPRFVAVLGPAGSGKTSLVHAGLWPELRRLLGASALFTIDHPCLDPFEQLARQGLSRTTEDLGAALRGSGRTRGGRAVLVLDHAEELLLNPQGFVQKNLIEQVTQLLQPGKSSGGAEADSPPGADGAAPARGPDVEPVLILILRTDCLLEFAAVAPALVAIIEQSSLYVPATLELQEWMAIVREPARALGVQIDTGLLAAIAHDLGELERELRERRRSAGVLSALSFVLTRMWERREGAVLRAAEYQALGGLKDAIARWADATWSALPNKAASRRSLLTLLETSSASPAWAEQRLLLRPRTLSEWRAGEPSASASIDATNAASLVSLYKSGLLHIQEAEDSLELVSSVLLEEWPLLHQIYRDEQRFVSWHTDMVELAQPQSDPEATRAPASALSIQRLAESERWLLQRSTEIDGAVRRYVERSRAQQERSRVVLQDRPSTQTLAFGFLALVLLVGLFLQWYLQQRELQGKDFDLASERGAHAGILVMQPGQDSSALALAIKAVAPSLRGGRPVPPLAKEGLMTAYSQAKISLPLHGHSDRVDVAVFDPSGQRVLTGSTDRTARIWDARTGKLLLTLSGHRATLTSVAFSGDGTRALTTSMDHTARIWDARSGQLLYELSGHTDVIESGTFSLDGTRVLTAGHDNTARIWDVHSGRLMQTLSGHGDRVTVATFSRDSHYILTASWDKTARLWDSDSGNLIRILQGHTDRLNVAAFSADSQHIATGGWDEAVRLWDIKDFSSVVLPHGSRLHALCFSPDSRWLATAGTNGSLKLWDGQKGSLRAVLSGHTGTIDALDFAPDSIHLVTGGGDRMVRLWDVRVEQPIAILPGHTDQVYTASFSPSGAKVVTSSYDQTARIWDVRAGQPLAILKGHNRELTSASFSPDGTRILTSSDDQTARLWRWPGGLELAVLREHRHAVNLAIFSADGNLIATTSSDSDVRLWDGHTGQFLRVLHGHEGPVYAAAFSPDGTTLVSGGADHTLRLWDPKTGSLRAEVPGHPGNAMWIVYSPDGRLMVTAGSEGEAWVRDGKSAMALRQLQAHGARVNQAQFFRFGNELRLVTASSDRSVRIFDPLRGVVLSTLQSFADVALSASLSPDGRRLLVVSRDQGTSLWDMTAEMPLAVLPDYTEEMVTANYAPPDGRYFLIGSKDGTVKVYVDDYPANLAGTFSDACDLLRYQRDFERVQADCPPPN
jgi:WD40 repeat protein